MKFIFNIETIELETKRFVVICSKNSTGYFAEVLITRILMGFLNQFQ